MVVNFGPQTKYGPNVGVEAAYEAFRHVILAVDVRYYGAPKSALPMHIVEDDVITKPIDEIETTIGLGTLTSTRPTSGPAWPSASFSEPGSDLRPPQPQGVARRPRPS